MLSTGDSIADSPFRIAGPTCPYVDMMNLLITHNRALDGGGGSVSVLPLVEPARFVLRGPALEVISVVVPL